MAAESAFEAAVPSAWWLRRARPVGSSLAAVALALLAGAVIIALVGGRPGTAYRDMVRGSVGSRFALSQTLVQATPLLLIGLGLALAFRARAWNIGAEGQFHVGALLGSAVALALPIPWAPAMMPVVLVAGMAGGALWGWVPGVLRGRWGVNEVISSLLLNYVALFLYSYAIRRPLREPGGFLPQSAELPSSAILPSVPGLDVHVGLLVGLALVPAVAYLMDRTPFGFRLGVMGLNREAASAAGIPTGRMVGWVMALSGAFAGLAGIVQIMGVQGRLLPGLSAGLGGGAATSGLGFVAIIVALLGRMRPLGVAASALFLAALSTGGEVMQRTQGIPFPAVFTIQALFIVFLLVADRLARRA